MRRVALAAGFLVAVLALAAALFLNSRTPFRAVENFASCRERGYSVEPGPPPRCVTADGTIFRSDDRTVYLHTALPFSFSYPATLLRDDGSWPVLDVMTASGISLEVMSVTKVSQQDIFSSLLPSASSGAFSIVRARVDASHLITAVVPLPGKKESVALAVIPLHPPVRYHGRSIENIVLRGTPSLVQSAIDSLAFNPVPTKVPRLFLP